MQYHLDTIPVWEAMEWKQECPLCGLQRKTEAEEIERTLGASVMEPEVRILVNKRGICREHHRMLFAQQNRLGHALLMDSHVKEQLETLRRAQKQAETFAKGKVLRFGKLAPIDSIIASLQKLNAHCVVCDAVATHMARYNYTFLHLWRNNPDFRKAWQSSYGVCLPHAAALIEASKKHLNPAQQGAFAAEALAFLTERLTEDEQDLD